MSCTISWAVLLLLLCLTTGNVKSNVYSIPSSVKTYMIKIFTSKANWTTPCTDGFRCNKTLILPAIMRTSANSQPVFDKRKNISDDLRAKFQFKIDKENCHKLLATEFRIYKQNNPLTKVCQNNTYVVRLYQINYPGQASNLLETRVLRSSDEGWQFFDISQTEKMWEENPSTNYGLELAVENSLNLKLNPFKAGFVGFGGPEQFRPFIVSFLKRIKSIKSCSSSFKFPNHQQSDRLVESGTVHDPGSKRRFWSGDCQRRAFYFNYNDLGQSSSIILPPNGFMGYACEGVCQKPEKTDQYTNHAILQYLVHMSNPKKALEPCCVPTKLSSLSVVFNDNGRAVAEDRPDLVVEECGCR